MAKIKGHQSKKKFLSGKLKSPQGGSGSVEKEKVEADYCDPLYDIAKDGMGHDCRYSKPAHSNHYVAVLGCDNCGSAREISIRQGIRIRSVKASVMCPTCGCWMGEGK